MSKLNYSVQETQVRIVSVESLDKDLIILRQNDKSNFNYILDIYSKGQQNRCHFSEFELRAVRDAIDHMLGKKEE